MNSRRKCRTAWPGTKHIPCFAAALFAVVLLVLPDAHAQTPPAATDEPMPKFDADYLKNPKAIKVGEDVWVNQCRHCHGNAAYPGKAPKLSPGSLDPEFIFDRVTYGFRKMPAWKEAFTLEQRKGVVAYIKSDRFSP